MTEKRIVCVTGASGYIGSWLVKRLLERGYHVRAAVRDPGNERKVKNLLELPNASAHLSLWKADLTEESSYDDAVQGCHGVFHVATPMELLYHDEPAENEDIESTTVNGILSIMRSCTKAKTVKRFIYTSSTGTVIMQRQPPLHEYTEELWSDLDFCYETKMFAWTYVVAKTTAEKAAWKYAEENGINMVTIHPSLVLGQSVTLQRSFSTDAATALYTQDEANIALLKKLHNSSAVHVDDVCNAHIYLFEHPLAKGRYICSTHIFDIFEIGRSLSHKYPDKNIPTEFEGLEESPKIIPCSSKKLIGLGFEFAHKNKDVGDLCAETIEWCRVKGASGYIGSWLVKRLLERGYHVRATVRDPGNERKVKNLLELPNASTHLSLWKADLTEESSYDDAVQGCQGVFHVATPMELLYHDEPAENEEIESTTVNGILSIMRSCSKAKTVKRFVYTSSTGNIMMQRQPPVDEYTEEHWSDLDLCYELKMFAWKYVVAKTTAERAAWKYAEENGIDMVTVHPSLVLGQSVTPQTSFSTEAATVLYTKDEANIALPKKLHNLSAVHVDDVCNAHIFLFEHPLAKGRYICSTHIFNIFEVGHSLGQKYPDKNIPTEFEGLDKSPKIIPCSSKKLIGLGFEFAHKNKDVGDLCAETIEWCRVKGLL
ncbi:hypothetical protein ACET3Z_018357 [Daucus carota]